MQSPTQQTRRLVPQWRRFKSATKSNELAMPHDTRGTIKVPSLEPDLISRVEAFRKNPSLVAAAELVESAIVLGHEFEGVSAARVILRSEYSVKLVRAHASQLLCRTGHADEVQEEFSNNIVAPRVWRASGLTPTFGARV